MDYSILNRSLVFLLALSIALKDSSRKLILGVVPVVMKSLTRRVTSRRNKLAFLSIPRHRVIHHIKRSSNQGERRCPCLPSLGLIQETSPRSPPRIRWYINCTHPLLFSCSNYFLYTHSHSFISTFPTLFSLLISRQNVLLQHSFLTGIDCQTFICTMRWCCRRHHSPSEYHSPCHKQHGCLCNPIWWTRPSW